MNCRCFLRIFILLLTGLCFGCGSVKHPEMMMLTEMQNELIKIDSLPVLKIKTDDILNIQVASRNPETVRAFYQRGEAAVGASGERALGAQEGYRVDEEGNIYLPFIGKIKAEGETILQLRQNITDSLVQFIPDASIQVRFLNFRVTLLGEVNRPNTYIIPNERLTILEAIGMAGDFTPYARRNSVLVIRERAGSREFSRINTQDKSIFESPYFYLSPNDILYIEPLRAKQYATQGDFLQRYSGILIPMVSLLTFVLGTTLSK
ncbi:MAG: polysaccharide biosynthesis/export family protein [Lewinellaceae bacterium]|nr:polysaccharide biosynthesis/export family protein [Lewinellaceae bacterium]